MTPDRIKQLQSLIHQANNNAWKRETGCPSERQAANESDRALVSRLCGALDEALTELEAR